MMYQNSDQINGTSAHNAVDTKTYSDEKQIYMAMDVFCEKYNLIGKIDVYDSKKKLLRERKKKIKTIYDGYIFQVYAQYFSLIEMGYSVERIELYSLDDNKCYPIRLPQEDAIMFGKFEETLAEIRSFNIRDFIQTNSEKCKRCIYEPACDRGI